MPERMSRCFLGNKVYNPLSLISQSALTITLKTIYKQPNSTFKVAGALGFEPRLADPESAVLPLYDAPECGEKIIYSKPRGVKPRKLPPPGLITG